ncbi:unnamed protein product [Periconia digitata]|uniref:Serine hydrolase domain-containing protein n=1 Tax=Periconia digitata TaxID=1303443 RepID=A0A9W4UFB3_9PLEO|nr:unnamed protein product [Periconia digitata]
MRVLCLHASGSNAQTFEDQLSAIRYQLGGRHQYEFVEGTLAAKADLGVTSTLSPDARNFAYFEPDSPQSLLAALNDLERYVELEGPFDGLIAFSDAGVLASTFLVRQARRNPKSLGIGMAVFFSGQAPLDPDLLADGKLSNLDHGTVGEVICIPTAHIMGLADCAESEGLVKLCKDQVREVFVHDGGLEVPNVENRAGVVGSARAIERTIWRIQANSGVQVR